MDRKSYLAQQLPTDTKQNRIRSFAFVISVSVSVCFCIGFAASSFSRLQQSCEIRLESRINPNDAPLASLVRLPGIGIARAEAIVAYRKKFIEHNGNKPAFEVIDDLQKVRGIGPKTAQNIGQWMKFE